MDAGLQTGEVPKAKSEGRSSSAPGDALTPSLKIPRTEARKTKTRLVVVRFESPNSCQTRVRRSSSTSPVATSRTWRSADREQARRLEPAPARLGGRPPLAAVFLGAWFVDPAVLPAAENGLANLTLAGEAKR